jgi:adenylate kinase
MTDGTRFRTILLFGMPGSGKGTQGAVLAQLPGIMHISTGDLFRRLPKGGSFSQEVTRYTRNGRLVPDELTIRIFKRHLQILTLQEEIDPASTVLLLDGIPRNYGQAATLDSLLDVQLIFALQITDVEEAKARLAARALKENRLDDASEEVILRRFRIYEQETAKTLEFYDRSLIQNIDASQTPLRVHRDIINALAAIEDRVILNRSQPALTPAGDGDRTRATVG